MYVVLNELSRFTHTGRVGVGQPARHVPGGDAVRWLQGERPGQGGRKVRPRLLPGDPGGHCQPPVNPDKYVVRLDIMTRQPSSYSSTGGREAQALRDIGL